MSDMTEIFDRDGFTASYGYDNSPESPRDWDNIGTVVIGHRKYSFGDYDYKTLEDINEHEADVWRNDPHAIMLDIYMYKHGEIVLNTSGFSCPWDSGKVGFIYVTRERVREEMARPKYKEGEINPKLSKIKRITKADRERVEKVLRAEIETLSAWVNGEVYYVQITDNETGEVVESLGGVYGLDYAEEYANEEVNRLVKNKEQEREETVFYNVG